MRGSRGRREREGGRSLERRKGRRSRGACRAKSSRLGDSVAWGTGGRQIVLYCSLTEGTDGLRRRGRVSGCLAVWLSGETGEPMEVPRGCHWANWPDANYWRRANPTLPTATDWLAGQWELGGSCSSQGGGGRMAGRNKTPSLLHSPASTSHHITASPVRSHQPPPFLLGLARLYQCPSWMRPIRLSALLADAMAGSWSHLTSQQRRAS